MGDLTKNFSEWEFRCRCCGELKLNMTLVEGLQKIRDFAGKPISVVSGYRCDKHNKAVGGAKNSQHLLATAADIYIRGMRNLVDMFFIAETVEVFRNGGIGLYPNKEYIHVDVRSNYARWFRVNGRYYPFSKLNEIMKITI